MGRSRSARNFSPSLSCPPARAWLPRAKVGAEQGAAPVPAVPAGVRARAPALSTQGARLAGRAPQGLRDAQDAGIPRGTSRVSLHPRLPLKPARSFPGRGAAASKWEARRARLCRYYLWLPARDLVSSSATGARPAPPPPAPELLVPPGNSRGLPPTCCTLVTSVGFGVERDRAVRPAAADSWSRCPPA